MENYINRKKTNEILIGNKKIGNFNPILIQSMTNTKTHDVKSTVAQILALEEAGCEIVRVAVPDMEAAKSIAKIKEKINIPLVADIHFDYKLAIRAMEEGIDKIRINPGNVGSLDNVKEIVKLAKLKNIPIRIGVNSGSLEKEILAKYGGVTPEALVESALKHTEILEKLDYNNIIISIKASNVPFSIKTYSLISEKVHYPLHLGITEAGTAYAGTVKSSVGIGAILAMGIGDTIRVSLTSDPVQEIKCAREILKSLNLRNFGPEFVSCPTCGRTEINLIKIAEEVEKRCKILNKQIKIAVMGCVVNGPGEAKEADIGIAGGKGMGIIFKKGEIVKTVQEENLVEELMKEIDKI